MVSQRLLNKGPQVVAIVEYFRSLIPDQKEVADALGVNINTLKPKLARGEMWPLILHLCECLGIESLEIRKIYEENGVPWEPKVKPNEVPRKNRRGRPRKKKPT